MPVPKVPRPKSPSKVGKGPAPWKAPKKNYFQTLMETPEGRELRKQWSTKPRKNAGRPRGVPDGHRKETIEPIRNQAQIEAKKVVEIMSKDYDIENDYAKAALETAVEIMKTPGDNRERVNSARLILEYTKAKPASKSELAISKAEDFLASLVDTEEENDDGQEATSST